MSVNNLTSEEATARADLLSVASYEVELDLTDGGDKPGDVTFRSSSVVHFTCSSPGASTYLDLTAPSVREVTLNGQPVDPDAFDGNRITLDGLAGDNELRVVAECAYMTTGEGLHRFVDPVDGSVYLYSQFETFDAHRMFACFDQPDLKATFGLTVRAPVDWVCVSNGAVVSSPEEGAAGTWTFATTPRISTYITALVAGPYVRASDSWTAPGGAAIPLGIYCRRSLFAHLDADALFAVTKEGFEFFHALFDYPYPFGKYDQLFVPEFNAGAMENAACVTFLEDYVFRSKVTDASYERRAETVLHEMAHMWFGDLVTMRWWDDLWLNESFATYISVFCQAEATRWTNAWTTFANIEKTWAYRQDQLPSTHPIACDIADVEAVKVNFDGITYAKGASVLKQLVAWVGRDAFREGLRTYFRRYEYANTSLHDLLTELETASGRDLSGWAAEWLGTAGVNTLRASFETDAEGRFRAFSVLQEAPADHSTLRSHRVAIGLYDFGTGADGRGGLVRTARVELDVVGAKTEVSELLGATQPDLVLVNDDDLTYAKIRLDPRSLATVTERIGELTESLPRALCWAAAWDMTRDGEMAARDYLRLVLAGIGAETDIGLVQGLLRQTSSALALFADPGYATTGRRLLGEAALGHLRAADPGSDHQLAWARAFASNATGDDQVAVVRSLLDGSAGVDGLALDPELRWHLVTRLAALGGVGEDVIDAELGRDPTAAGQRQAAGARAALPALEAKQQAWSSVVERGELHNALQAATIGGFVQVEQVELLERFVDPYFASIEEVWSTRTSEMAQAVVIGLYPGLVVSPSVVEKTDAYLTSAEPPPALRRLLLEGRDGVARALRARSCDRAAADG